MNIKVSQNTRKAPVILNAIYTCYILPRSYKENKSSINNVTVVKGLDLGVIS